jgi:hypothetical protein
MPIMRKNAPLIINVENIIKLGHPIVRPHWAHAPWSRSSAVVFTQAHPSVPPLPLFARHQCIKSTSLATVLRHAQVPRSAARASTIGGIEPAATTRLTPTPLPLSREVVRMSPTFPPLFPS